MRLLVTLLLTFSFFSGCAYPSNDLVKVVRVIDGDTIEIEGGARVRYIGIDTPEVRPDIKPYGLEASAKNKELVEGQKVRLEKDASETDRYGRLLRYVYVDNLLVNAELVRLGLARARAYPPDTRYQETFSRLEAEAKKAKRGMWSSNSARVYYPGLDAMLDGVATETC